MRRRAGAWLGVLVGLGACTEPNPYLPMLSTGEPTSTDGTGTEVAESSDSTGDDTSESTSDDGTSACAAAGGECIAAAPEDWAGPFAWLERPVDLPPVPCPAPWDQALTEAFSDVSAPAARCRCSCGDLLGASCGSVTIQHNTASDCTGALLNSAELSDAMCEVLPAPSGWGTSGGYSFAAPTVVGGMCIPSAQTELREASFLTRHQACGAEPMALDCDADQLCATPPLDPLHPRYCVWQEGDVACPDGSVYADPRRLFRALDDQRGCEPCSCEPPRGTCEGASVSLFDGFTCGMPDGGVGAGGCVAAPPTGVRALRYNEGTPPDACEPANVVPIGDASGAEPVTFCCTLLDE